jgi:hypothetical protein
VFTFLSSLYILGINPLAMIISHSECCLFALLTISFAVQKYLSLF